VLVEIKATGICHTDEFTLSGADPEGHLPGHPGPRRRRRRRRGRPGRDQPEEGRSRHPALHAGMPRVRILPIRKTNLCQADPRDPGPGPDARRHLSRFSLGGKPIHHYMGCSTFSNYTVLPEIALAKVREDAPFDKICYIGCGVTTGIGAVINTAKVEPGANVVVFGLGGIGLNVIQGARWSAPT
jgi:S-(hydroxymethyl)glutathione dehydrogenase/alcohol dehydrogenase